MWSFRVGFRPGVEEQASAPAVITPGPTVRLRRQGIVAPAGSGYEIYNAAGRLVCRLEPGTAVRLPAGMYFIQSPERRLVQKLVVLE